MSRICTVAALACGLAALTLAAPTGAQAQSSISPYFMVILDNSGSMDATIGPSGTLNSCGQRARRIADAKCVLQRVVNGYGDVTFGLERFATTSSGSCSASCGGATCGCSQSALSCSGCADSGSGCPASGSTAAQGQILVPIQADNQDAIVRWIDYTCSTCSATGTNPELEATTWTPLAGSLRGARRYFQGGDPTFPTSPLAGDPAGLCRPVSVILLTDGEETCASDAQTIAAATELRSTTVGGLTYNIRTYVIGFGITAGDSNIEAIATAGGTDAPGTHRGFYATDETSLALAFSQIVADSILFEVCNGADDDCDTRIDEGVLNACGMCGTPPAESCNGLDDDCDTRTDEGVLNACGVCGPTPLESCNSADDDCDGAIDEGVCGGCIPSPEICDGIDNDCNGVIDNFTRPCGSDVGECSPGTQRCLAGVWGACNGTGPTAELCNNLDDDCDGRIDGQVQMCGSSVGACRPGARICTAGMFGPCVGQITATTEICNGIDDDCDTRTDEGDPGGGASCGSGVGRCMPGTLRCLGGALTCTGGTSPMPETCNNIDDDCDGRVDEGNPGGGAMCGSTDVGECEFGTMRCVMGGLTCTGARGPTAELCNGLDDDCDTRTDEGDPEAGMACGDDTGECMAGVTRCTGGMLTCFGAVGPTPEVCNGLDDDCDGAVDDEIAVGAPCGSDVGECIPGINICDPATGALVCSGEVGPIGELCNLLDDDCDAMVDEGLSDGASCGTDEGACMAGVLRCVEGRDVCVGEVPGTTETCDCEDNDCDGMTDEPPPMGSLCPMGSECIDCGCSRECVMGEFGPQCPTGRVPSTVDGRCFCVAIRCTAEVCGTQTIEMDGVTLCGPDMADVAECVCRANECTFSCDGVVCEDGLACNPRDPRGPCVEDNCRGLGCASGEVCNRATGACETDPCATAGCTAEQVCRAGVCEASCADVECMGTDVCRRGVCVTDLCAGVSCGSGEACDPSSGSCVTDMCVGVRCPTGTVCTPTTGSCDEEPCSRVVCPSGQSCRAGECLRDAVAPDGGTMGRMDAGTGTPGDPDRRVLATGGGGILCAVRAAGSSRGTFLGLALFGAAFLASARRRRRVRAQGTGQGGAR